MKGGLSAFAGVKVNISCLEVPGCWLSTTKKNARCADTDVGSGSCCTLAITVAGCVLAEHCTTYMDTGGVLGMVSMYSRPAVAFVASGS